MRCRQPNILETASRTRPVKAFPLKNENFAIIQQAQLRTTLTEFSILFVIANLLFQVE